MTLMYFYLSILCIFLFDRKQTNQAKTGTAYSYYLWETGRVPLVTHYPLNSSPLALLKRERRSYLKKKQFLVGRVLDLGRKTKDGPFSPLTCILRPFLS